jgi:hypothetical protein
MKILIDECLFARLKNAFIQHAHDRKTVERNFRLGGGWWVAPEFTLSFLAAALFLSACRSPARNRPSAFVN